MIKLDDCDVRNYNNAGRIQLNFNQELGRLMDQSKSKRYCLEKLIMYDGKSCFTWKRTKVSSEDAEVLNAFLGEGYRIFDVEKNVEVKRNVDLRYW
jgi:hypothetical protein